MERRKELEHFWIGRAFGGSQEWFPGRWMNLGGCGAATACDCCIDLARVYGLTELYPYDSMDVKKIDYQRFADRMRRFLPPRKSGIDTLKAFMDGFRSYLDAIGSKRLSMRGFSGEEPYEKAVKFVKWKLDADIPIPCLVLLHPHPVMKEYVWHWFLIVGYQEFDGHLFVKTATYGNWDWLPFEVFWNPGSTRKGGMISLDIRE